MPWLRSIHLIPRSHKLGCINPGHHSGFLTEEQAQEHCDQNEQVYLELQPGDLALLHNHTIHKVLIRAAAFSFVFWASFHRDSALICGSAD